MRSYLDVRTDIISFVNNEHKIVETLVALHRHRKEDWKEGRQWWIARHPFDVSDMLEVGFADSEWPSYNQPKLAIRAELVEMARSILVS